MTSSDHAADWPAWIQAIGSLTAVAGAASIAAWQSVEANAREKRARALSAADRESAQQALYLTASRLVTIFRIKLDAFIHTTSREEDGRLKRPKVGSPTLRAFRGALDRLEAFPLVGLRQPQAVVLVARACETADLCVDLIDEMRENSGRFPVQAEAIIRKGLESLTSLAADMVTVDEALRELAEPGWRSKSAEGGGGV